MRESAAERPDGARELEAGGRLEELRREDPMKRRLNLRFAAPLLLALAAACATSSSSQSEQEIAVITASGNTVLPQPGDELICEYEETVGSHIPKRICRSKADLESLRQETVQSMRDLRPTPPPPG